MTIGRSPAQTDAPKRPKRPRGSVRDGLVAAGLELARAGGPDAVVLREATRIVGVVPNAAYRHFADRDELLAAVCAAAMNRFGTRVAADVAGVPGDRADPDAALERLGAIGSAYLRFAHDEPGLFATAFGVPHQHTYAAELELDLSPLNQLRAVLDELVDAGVLDPRRRAGVEFPVWAAVHGLAVLLEQGPLREMPEAERRQLVDRAFAFIGDGIAPAQA